MADDKHGREAQARNAENRQREREIAAELQRGDEPEPPVEAATLAALEPELESLSFPATADTVVGAVGDRELDAAGQTYTIEQLLPNTTAERFESPASVRKRIQRPTVAAAMKRIVEATENLQSAEFGTSQRDAYEKTLLELKAIDADDDDESIGVIADWIVSQIKENGDLPGSRAVRRQAASFCRKNGYEISTNDWLGV